MQNKQVSVPSSQLELLVRAFAAQGGQDGDELRKRLAVELAAREAVTQEAIKLRLDKDGSVVAALAYARRNILVNA